MIFSGTDHECEFQQDNGGNGTGFGLFGFVNADKSDKVLRYCTPCGDVVNTPIAPGAGTVTLKFNPVTLYGEHCPAAPLAGTLT